MCDSDVTARGLVCIDLDVKGCYIYIYNSDEKAIRADGMILGPLVKGLGVRSGWS